MKITLLSLADKTVDALDKYDTKQVAKSVWLELLRQKKLSSLDRFIELVEQRGAQKKGRLRAYVTSAAKLNDDDLVNIEKKLEQKYHQPVDIDAQIDSNILGGIKIKIADEIIDMSWRGKINSLKVKLGVGV